MPAAVTVDLTKLMKRFSAKELEAKIAELTGRIAALEQEKEGEATVAG